MYIKEDPMNAAKRPRVAGGYSGASTMPGATYMPPAALPTAPGRPVAYVPINNTKDNPPCNTLFIGNLGDNVDEGELLALMATQPVSTRYLYYCP